MAEHVQARWEPELAVAERVVEFVARRHGLTPDEREEFRSVVFLRLLEDDAAILVAHGGEAALSSYLATVINRLLIDHRRAEWGKWKPSAAARRAGGAAVRLEEALRDGMSLDEGIRHVRDNLGFDAAPEELEDVASRFPQRIDRRGEALDDRDVLLGADGDPASVAERRERAREMDRLRRLLRRCLGELDGEDRLIVRMRYLDGTPISEIARSLRLEQRPLYRRVHRLTARLRRLLEAEGVSADVVRTLLAGVESAATSSLQGAPLGPRPEEEKA